jgi:hypothetical protein
MQQKKEHKNVDTDYSIFLYTRFTNEDAFFRDLHGSVALMFIYCRHKYTVKKLTHSNGPTVLHGDNAVVGFVLLSRRNAQTCFQ